MTAQPQAGQGMGIIARIEQFWLQQDSCGRRGPLLGMMAVMALLLTIQNPLWYGMAPAFDASVFASMGKMWADGDVLYRDMIDIKGPVIFLLDAIGYKLGGFRGMALFETVLLTLGLYSTWQALALLALRPLARFAALLGVLGLIGFRYYYGNMTEDWAFCLALVAQYSFMRLLVDGRFSWQQAWIPALTVGLVALLRMNNAAFWAGWYPVLFLGWCWQGKWRDALALLASALLGIAVVAVPLVAYFNHHGVLQDFWFYGYAIFMGNNYGNGHSLSVGAVGVFRTGLILLLPGVLWLLHRWQHDLPARQPRVWTSLAAVLVLGTVASVVANSVSGHIYDHYDQIVLAFLPLPLALLCQAAPALRERTGLIAGMTLVAWVVYLVVPHLFFVWTRFEWPMAQVVKVLATAAVVALLAAVALVMGLKVPQGERLIRRGAVVLLGVVPCLLLAYSVYYGLISGRPFNARGWQQVQQVRAETAPQDRIWVEGTIPQFYVWADRKAASPYLFFDNVSPGYDVKARVLADLQRVQPKFVVVRSRLLDSYTQQPESLSASRQAMFAYLYAHYDLVQPGLFRIKGWQPVTP